MKTSHSIKRTASHSQRYSFINIGGRTTTDDEGRFEFDSLPKPCTFTFYAPRGYSKINDLQLEVDTGEEHVIRLEKAAAVRGRVIDSENGEPVKAFTVKLSFCRNLLAGDPELDSISTRLIDPGTEFSGPAGSFAIDGLKHRCPFQVTIESPGYERHVVTRIVAIHADEKIPEIKIRKLNPDDYHIVHGRLLSKRGKPIRGVQVRLLVTQKQQDNIVAARFPFNWTMIQNGQVERRAECLQFLSATTNEIGLFTFPKVKRDQELTVYYWGGEAAPGRIENVSKLIEGREAFEVTTDPAAQLRIRFDPEEFSEATGLTISSGKFGYKSLSLVNGQQEYTVDGLAADTYSVSIQGQRERTGANSFTVKNLAIQSVALTPGEDRTVQFSTDDLRENR